MKPPNILTKEKWLRYLDEGKIVDLSKFTGISDEAAESVEGNCGGDLDLCGLTDISSKLAKTLAKHGPPAWEIDLSGLETLSEGAASELGKRIGGIRLNGLREITPTIARHLAQPRLQDSYETASIYRGEDFASGEFIDTYRLLLNGLQCLPAPVARELSRHTGGLYLDGIKTMPDESAASLGRHLGCLSLNGISALSDKALSSLSRQRGNLFLNGLTALSPPAAFALGNHRQDIFLGGLKKLSYSAAISLTRNLSDDNGTYLHIGCTTKMAKKTKTFLEGKQYGII